MAKLKILKVLNFNFREGYFGVNFGHLKSEVFHFRGRGAFWSEIPERGFLENLDKNLLFSQKPACASQIVSHILRMWRLTSQKERNVASIYSVPTNNRFVSAFERIQVDRTFLLHFAKEPGPKTLQF